MSAVYAKHGNKANGDAISLIITTIKDEILTLKSLKSCPVPYEVIVSKKYGLGFASMGFNRCRTELVA